TIPSLPAEGVVPPDGCRVAADSLAAADGSGDPGGVEPACAQAPSASIRPAARRAGRRMVVIGLLRRPSWDCGCIGASSVGGCCTVWATAVRSVTVRMVASDGVERGHCG